jgi:hypothetical protein
MTVDWKVIVEYDSDHRGHDYAYTVGLHDHGQPELYLWARPTDGDDPGADWILGDLDLTIRLHEFGAALIAGTLAPGDSVDVAYARGFATASMILRRPVPAHGSALDVPQVAPDANVCEIRWSLEQRPLGPRRELTDAEVREARGRLAAFIGELGAAPVTFPASARFGPHTPVVEVLRLQARSLDDHRAERLLDAVLMPEIAGSDISPVLQAGRAAGLVDEVEEAFTLARVDAEALAERVYGEDAELVREVTDLFGTVFSVAYGNEMVRHELPGPPLPSSEVMWALLDPDGARTRRYVDRVTEADPVLGRIFERPDLERLASIVRRLDDPTIAGLASLWVQAAVLGHGSGLWLMAALLDPMIPHDTQLLAGVALATAGNAALDVPVPDDAGRPFRRTVRRVVADVRASAPVRRAS